MEPERIFCTDTVFIESSIEPMLSGFRFVGPNGIGSFYIKDTDPSWHFNSWSYLDYIPIMERYVSLDDFLIVLSLSTLIGLIGIFLQRKESANGI